MFIYIILAVMEVPKEFTYYEGYSSSRRDSCDKVYMNLRGFEDVFNDDFLFQHSWNYIKKWK